VKHVPLRTCLACRRRRPKRSLVRLVRRADGTVAVDAAGVAPGRGAYVCAEDPACVERALKAGRLSQAFRERSRVDDGLERAVHEAAAPPMTFAHRR